LENQVRYRSSTCAGNPFSPHEHDNTNSILKIDIDPSRATYGDIVAHYHGTNDQYVPGVTYKPQCEAHVDVFTCETSDFDFGASPQLFDIGGVAAVLLLIGGAAMLADGGADARNGLQLRDRDGCGSVDDDQPFGRGPRFGGEDLKAPRVFWLMIPAGAPVDDTIQRLQDTVSPGDVIVDGGNSNYKDSIRRAEDLRTKQIEFLDVGVSGGIWGLKVGFCLMVGDTEAVFKQAEPIFKTLAPPDGYAYVGASGAGHYSKMVHNGIEYSMLQGYAEGFEILKAAPFGFDLVQLTRLWNHGSVIRSWILELAQAAFERDPQLSHIRGWVEDSGEGRWTLQEAIDHAVPAPALALSLFMRFRSRQDDSFSAKVLAALRNEFGGHPVKSE